MNSRARRPHSDMLVPGSVVVADLCRARNYADGGVGLWRKAW